MWVYFRWRYLCTHVHDTCVYVWVNIHTKKFLVMICKYCLWSASWCHHLAGICNGACEYFGLPLYMLVFCWPALTEGHGSCTLSVWTLAEPLGVLFQARSDNLAPTTRLATAQFTGRSSTQATPSPHLSSSQLLLSLLSFPLSSPCTLLHLSILPSLWSQLSQYLLPCCYLTQTFRLSFLFLSISMTLL